MLWSAGDFTSDAETKGLRISIMAVNAFGEAGKVAARRRSNFLVSFVSDNKRNSQIESENKRSSQIDGGNKRSSTVSMADEHEVDEGIEDVDNEAVEKEAEQVLQRCQEQRRTSLKQMLSTRLERRPSVVDVMERNVLQMDVTTIDTTGTTGAPKRRPSVAEYVEAAPGAPSVDHRSSSVQMSFRACYGGARQ
ncbi:hypothetical protein CYMTET_14003 [Cymbomonas tetramitiformis]|uniref:Uncharacterized protein n=1 Tax=Cymbomonas tetramitiformis TaxID=36881 RepID=A0AAE0LAG0_9CHLO|nr:hypothetical protein CYMTET_14003 [Cymbomonas tetramitiformis]